jgi:CHAD domain-containing protein
MENGKGVWRLEAPRLQREEPLVVEQVQPGAEPATIEPTDAIERLRAMLERQYAQILLHDPGVRPDLDPEDVHRLRVAVRRARAVLRAARPLLDPEWSEPLRDELKWLGGSLGRRRDVDVLIAHLEREIEQLEQPERDAAASLVERLGDERTTAQAVALDTLRSERYYRLLDSLEAAARGPRVRRGQVSLRKLARSEFRRLSRIAERLGPSSSDDDLHRAAGRLVERERARRREARAELPKAWRKLDRAAQAAFG